MKALLYFLLLAPLAAPRPALAQLPTPPGAYRTAAAYRQRLPRPGGIDAFYPDKRGQLVVQVARGPRTEKLRVAPDSVWGYVSGKGRTVRFYRGQEYYLEHADTLCVYSSTTQLGQEARAGTSASAPAVFGAPGGLGAARYFFSRGLTGLIFPLTPRYLREAYAAGNPAFVAALAELRLNQSLADYDRKTGLYRVTTLYRAAAAPR